MKTKLILVLIILCSSLAVFGHTSKRKVHRYTTGCTCSTILNGRAISLPEPEYPEAALATGAQGVVRVRVLIDEDGNVISASAMSGAPVLKAAAVKAAKGAKFRTTIFSGQPVKVSGNLVYKFTAPPKTKLATPENR
jgi:TonB family protein